jgi:ADP-heptose:LPS heptosyltransferase
MDHPRLPATMLVDLPNWVGDQMMAMPALNRLVEGNCGGETVLHTRPPMVRFLSAVFPQTRVIASPRKFSPFFSARELREGGRRFEIGITLRNAARGKILIRLSARWCAGSRGEGAEVLLSAPFGVDRGRHQVHDADSVLEILGLEAADPSWRPELPRGVRGEGEAALRSVGIDGQRAIGLAPSTARGETKRWPARYFGELATRLRARGREPVIVIGPGEEVVAEELCRAAQYELPVVGTDMDIAGLAATAAGLRLLVGNDSGPMQVAVSIGTPVVAMFGPTDRDRTAPRGSRHRVVSPPTGCDDCMRNISVDEVEAAIIDLEDRDRNTA